MKLPQFGAVPAHERLTYPPFRYTSPARSPRNTKGVKPLRQFGLRLHRHTVSTTGSDAAATDCERLTWPPTLSTGRREMLLVSHEQVQALSARDPRTPFVDKYILYSAPRQRHSEVRKRQFSLFAAILCYANDNVYIVLFENASDVIVYHRRRFCHFVQERHSFRYRVSHRLSVLRL
ncbi:hypothetical protein MRX96_019044 [Rhipicephalus microplus]